MDVKQNKWKIIGLTFVIIVALIGGYIYTQLGAYDKSNSEDIVIEIPSGATVNTMSDILYENKLIKNEALFKVAIKLSNKVPNIQAGKYLLNQTYSNMEIINVLASGKLYQDGIKVTIPEGSTSKEITSILINKELGEKSVYEELIKTPSEFYDEFEFLKEEDIVSLEGFLYPETYFFDEDVTEREVLSAMLSTFDSLYTKELKERQEELKLTLQEVVSMASIIEKEAVLDTDRATISSVFYNRLDIDMPLQSDATIQYIFEERKKIVTYADLEIDSPYNSYLNKGLPPTPIASPGIKSIEASLYPEDTDYLFFVATIEGGNRYSETYDQHQIYVNEYREDRDKLNQEKLDK